MQDKAQILYQCSGNTFKEVECYWAEFEPDKSILLEENEWKITVVEKQGLVHRQLSAQRIQPLWLCSVERLAALQATVLPSKCLNFSLG